MDLHQDYGPLAGQLSRMATGISGVVLVAGLMLGATATAAAHAHYRHQAADSGCQPVRTFSQPPASFDPTAASDATLQAYGYPPRPAGDATSPAVMSWQQAVNDAKTFVPPNPVCGTAMHTDQYSGNWAGHVAINDNFSGTPHFTWAESFWTQPAVAGNGNYANSDYNNAPAASFWAGTGVNYIIQAGVDSISTATPQYKFWTEDFTNPTVWEGPVVHPGDQVYVYTHYNGDGTAHYYLENLTTQQASPFDNSAPYYGYAWADFVNERMNGKYLPGFADTTMYGDFGTDSQTWFLTTNNAKFIMTSNCHSTGTTLSKPTAVDNNTNTFTQQFYNSQPVCNG